ncbi:MAG: hypothetical protein ACI4XJ_06240 [Eubacteriales bacterium]
MFTVYSGYSLLENDKKTVFFAGANTERGFVSSYDKIADERQCERVYVIKGGSGSGKSSLMRRIADEAGKHGFRSEYFLCGSDPDSLDCVKIGGRIAVLDGTAPHVRDMIYPGAASELIDVSRFWDSDKLEARRGDIISICHGKSESYSAAYNLLSAAGLLSRVSASLASQIYLYDKAGGFIERLLSRLPKSKVKGRIKSEYYSHAVTMKGMVQSDSLKRLCEICYNADDFMNTAQIFMRQLTDALLEHGYELTVTRLPISDAISGILINDLGIAVTVGEKNENERNINLSRFVDREKIKSVRGRMRLNADILESVMNEVSSCLHTASEYHFALEEIYVSAMDFSRLNEYRDEITENIIKRLKKQD